VASVAVAAFIPAELCPDHLMAAGTLTPAQLPARDLGHGRLLSPACLSPHAATTRVGSRSPAELPGKVSGACAGDGRPGMRHRGLLPSPWHRGAAVTTPPVTARKRSGVFHLGIAASRACRCRSARPRRGGDRPQARGHAESL